MTARWWAVRRRPTGAFTTYTSAAFTVARPNTSPQFLPAAGPAVNGATLDVGNSAAPEVTDLDGGVRVGSKALRLTVK